MIRKYLNSDKEAILNILKLNTPIYFETTEEPTFINYLDNKTEDYFVIEKNKQIIGAGGINYFFDERHARLSWDLIDPNHQGKGFGKELVEFRINLIKNNPLIETIIVRTSQLAYNFYKKMGFELEQINNDYWAKGFDLYLMKLKLRNIIK